MPWLLASVTTSTPADRKAPKAEAGARKLNSLGAAVPRSVTAVSRFTMVTSAASGEATPDRSAVGSSSSWLANGPAKFTSPAKAKVTVRPEPSPGRDTGAATARGTPLLSEGNGRSGTARAMA